jgi:hypothetical protein
VQRILFSTMTLWILSVGLSAAERKFPYEAAIDVAEEYVRSGPGQNFYPTSKLRRGDRVTVHRHDLGGWVMIAPPQGSFSWIQADYVRRKDGSTGVVTENNVIVRVGSQFNDERDWFQRELNKGDAVEILGEQTFETDRGPVAMLKITPPAREFRWIMGRAIVSADALVRQPLKPAPVDNRPIVKKAPPKVAEPDPFSAGPVIEPPAVVDQPLIPKIEAPRLTESTRQTGPDMAQINDAQSRMAEIDKEFHGMIEQDPATWSLSSLEQRYRQLETQLDSPVFQTRIKQRLSAVERYTKIQQEYEEFVRVAAESKQRDAQLLSLKYSGTPSREPAGLSTNVPPNTPPSLPAAPPQPRTFDGAGIIRSAANTIRNGPQFVLVSPNGRLLAYLQPAPGVDLRSYVGQSMGVMGQRSYRQELQAELIVVRSLQPVKLRGP